MKHILLVAFAVFAFSAQVLAQNNAVEDKSLLVSKPINDESFSNIHVDGPDLTRSSVNHADVTHIKGSDVDLSLQPPERMKATENEVTPK
ncbi:MAG: hypothetical protein ACPGU4_14600 [Flavobacteriales bacterium]